MPNIIIDRNNIGDDSDSSASNTSYTAQIFTASSSYPIKGVRIKAFKALSPGIATFSIRRAAFMQDYYNSSDDTGNPFHGTEWDGQTFTATCDYTIKGVRLKLYRSNGNPGTITAAIRATSSGLPTGADLCSASVDGNAITTTSTGEWIWFDFGNGTSLSNGVKYVVIIKGGGADASNRIGWRKDNTSPTYSGGAVVYSTDSGSNWTETSTADYMFETYSYSSTETAIRKEYYTSGDDNSANEYGTTWMGQVFTATSTYTVSSVKLKMLKLGSSKITTVSIRAASGGLPTGSDLCVGTIDNSTITTDAGGDWYEISFSPGTILTSGSTYAIVFRTTTGDASNLTYWRRNSTSGSYSGGTYVVSTNSGSTWSSTGYTNVDAMFEIYASYAMNGRPVSADLTLGTIDTSTWGGTPGLWYEILFTSPYTLMAKTQYAICCRGTGSGGSGNYVEWRLDASSPTYSNGCYCNSGDTGFTWQNPDSTKDFMFETIMYPSSGEYGSGSSRFRGGALGKMDNVTVLQNYGYFLGGSTASSSYANTDRIDFSTGITIVNTSSNLSTPRYQTATSSDTKAYGYSLGGVSSVNVTVSDRTTFSSGTTAANTVSNISQARGGHAGLGDSVNYGYVAGGYTDARVATADRTTFSTGATSANTTSNLSNARYSLAALNDYGVYGYWCGGGTGGQLATTDRITFSTGTTAANTASNLSAARESCAGIGGTDYGYIAGGYTLTAVADRLVFSNSVTSANTSANLSQARYYIAGISDGYTYGYFAGGATSPRVATADRIIFSTSVTSANTVSNLSVPQYFTMGLSSVR